VQEPAAIRLPEDLVEHDDGRHGGSAEHEDRPLVRDERAAQADAEEDDRDRQPPRDA
jgi:hypothetical protein